MFSKQKFPPIRGILTGVLNSLHFLSLQTLFVTYQTDRGIWWLVVPWVWVIRKSCNVSFSVWPWGSWLPFIFPSSVMASEKEQHYPNYWHPAFLQTLISVAIIMRTLACMCVAKVINSTGFLYLLSHFLLKTILQGRSVAHSVALLPPIFLALEPSSR